MRTFCACTPKAWITWDRELELLAHETQVCLECDGPVGGSDAVGSEILAKQFV